MKSKTGDQLLVLSSQGLRLGSVPMRQLLAISALAGRRFCRPRPMLRNHARVFRLFNWKRQRSLRPKLVAAGAFTPPAGQQAAPGADGYKTGPGFLPGPRRPSSVERLGHQDRSVDARLSDGMGNIRDRVTAALPERLITPGLAGAVRRGYASAATDTGHAGEPPTPLGPWDIPRKSLTSATAAFTKCR